MKKWRIFSGRVLSLIMIGLMLSAALTGCGALGDAAGPPVPVAEVSPSVSAPAPTPTPTPQPRGSVTITVNVIGDVMMHSPQIPAGYDRATGTYNYDHFFEGITETISRADLSIANLETPTAGEANNGYSGYPLFNAPDALLTALQKAGVDVLATANNHCLDRRRSGLIQTIETMDELGIPHTGTFKNQEESDKILFQEINEVKVAIIAYTYGCNGMENTLEASELKWMVNMLDKDAMVADIKKAREQGADIVLVMPHWGAEYVRQPADETVELAKALVAAGADVIVGSHPHVAQPIEWLTVQDDSGKDVTGLVYYSTGNFISNQRDPYTDWGIMAEFGIEKNLDTGEVKIVDPAYIPTYVHRFAGTKSTSDYNVVPAGEYASDEQRAASLGSDGSSRVKKAWSQAVEHLGEDVAKPLEK